MELLPGQLITGRMKLSQQLKLTEREIRTVFKRLKTTNEIAIKTTNRFSIITICKWEQYQDQQTIERPTERPTNGHTNDQQTTTFKNVKNIENNLSIIFEEFRKKYPGTKRGSETELKNFLKKYDSKIAYLLLPALQIEKDHKDKLKSAGQFTPEWKNLSTWINNRCWEQEFPEVKTTNETDLRTPPTQFKEKIYKSVYELES